jgi:uncharacterized protein
MRPRLMLGLLSLALALHPHAPRSRALAASFDCGRASGCTENVICQTPQLSRLDSRMARLFDALQDAAGRRGARTLLDSQRAWLDNRDSCGCNANCLVSQYEARIRLFDDVLALE